MTTGCRTTVDRVVWSHPEPLEKIVDDVLGDASPPWHVTVRGSLNGKTWVIVAHPPGREPFSAVLTHGLHTPQHVRTVISEFYHSANATASL